MSIFNNYEKYCLFDIFLCIVCFANINTFNLETRLPVIKQGNAESYFGYSVAAHQSQNINNGSLENSWMLVGAPLDQNLQPGTNRSGALWKCPITTLTDDCVQVVTDGRRNSSNGHYKDSHITGVDDDRLLPPGKDEVKDDQWLGVTVKSQGPGGKVMVCAHRYMWKGSDSQWGRGLCYTLKQYLEFDGAWEPCKGKPVARAHEEFGYCQAGTSGLILEDDTALIGSPGPLTWRGTIFVFNISDDYLLRDKTAYTGPLSENDAPTDKYSYLGMSVTAGHFFGNGTMVYAAGAPRGKDTGQVVLFTKKKKIGENPMNVKLVLNGEQFASNFGYEVATADLNGDKESDLIVAAPFYFSHDSGGAVYIYINKVQNNPPSRCLDCRPPIKLTGKPESRFGLAVTNLGDINRDGCDDIAVGAPYEGNGVVYIYLGAPNDDEFSLTPSQVIKAEDIPSPSIPITTFGYSLSGGLDLDQNGYPDLVIGAYEKHVAILLRSRPIIQLTTSVGPERNFRNIDPSRKGCDLNKTSEYTCFSFEACCSVASAVKNYNGRQLILKYRLEAETFDSIHQFSRIWFGTHVVNESHISEGIININQKTDEDHHCQYHTAYLKNGTQDIQSPIRIKMTYSLVHQEPKPVRPGNPLPSLDNYPILNQQQADKVFAAYFNKDCGDDDICNSHLITEAFLQLPYNGNRRDMYELSLGEYEKLHMNISVVNVGEPAYEAQLFIVHPSNISYSGKTPQSVGEKVHVACSPFNATVVSCALGNPLKNDVKINIQLRFNLNDLDYSLTQLHFVVFSNSTSQEDFQDPNNLDVLVVKKTKLSLTGTSSPSEVHYGGQVKGESEIRYKDEIGTRVIHKYTIHNMGTWRISTLEIDIEWPFQAANDKPQGKWLLYLDENPVIDHSGGGGCLLPPEYVNPVRKISDRPTTPKSQEVLSHGSKSTYGNKASDPSFTKYNYSNTSPNAIHNRVRRDTEMVVRAETYLDKNGVEHKIVKMSCLLGTAKCITIKCIIHNLQSENIASVLISSRLWNATMIEDYPKVDYVQIFSRAKIHIPPTLVAEANTFSDEYQIETIAKVDKLQQVAQSVPLFIIIVAIIIGILVFILLTLLLWKLGFFKRRRLDPTLSGNLERHPINNESYHDYKD